MEEIAGIKYIKDADGQVSSVQSNEVDMTYSFLQDTEPTDEQLEQLMREVQADVIERGRKGDENFRQLLEKEFELAEERAKELKKKSKMWK